MSPLLVYFVVARIACDQTARPGRALAATLTCSANRARKPPIHTECLRSSGAPTLIFTAEGAKGRQLLCHALAIARQQRGTAGRHGISIKVLADIHVAFMMNWNVVPWIPLASLPTRLTWQSTLGPGDAPCAHGGEVAVGELIGFLLD